LVVCESSAPWYLDERLSAQTGATYGHMLTGWRTGGSKVLESFKTS